jgi:hypothetical protein
MQELRELAEARAAQAALFGIGSDDEAGPEVFTPGGSKSDR